MNYDYLLVPKLLHGPVAASWLKNKFDVLDESIIEAVRYHTTGYPGMGTVSKVVFLADKLDREKIKRNPELEKVLSLSVSDLDAAVLAYIYGAEAFESCQTPSKNYEKCRFATGGDFEK